MSGQADGLDNQTNILIRAEKSSRRTDRQYSQTDGLDYRIDFWDSLADILDGHTDDNVRSGKEPYFIQAGKRG